MFGEFDAFSLGTRDVYIETLEETILRLSNQFGIPEDHFVKIDFPLTHLELAHMIGATRESVTYSLNELSKQGIISTGRKKNLVDQKKAKESLALDDH